MPALSTSTIAASDSASKAAVRPGTRGADKSNDGSPFAALLTATSQQTTSPKPKSGATQAANNNDASAAKSTDPQTSTAQAALQSPPRARGDVSKDKRDKKTDSGDDSSDDVTAAAQQPPQPPVPIVAAAIAPAIPANTQAASTTEDDAGPDAIEAATSAATNNNSTTQPAGGINPVIANKPVTASPTVPQPAAQSAPANGQTGPGVQNPIAAADDTDSAPTDSPVAVSALAQNAVSTIIQNTGPAPQPKTSDGKPAIDKTASTKPVAKPQIDPQTLSQPAPVTDDDAEPVAQTVATTAPAATAPVPAASNDSATIAAATLAENAAPPPAPNPKDAAPANTPVQTAADANIPSPLIKAAMLSTTPSMAAVSSKDAANGPDAVQTVSNSDSKPVHIAAADATPQPDAPQAAPVPQPAPPALPQGMVTDNIVAAPLGASTANTGGAAVTTALHIAAADVDPTPTLSALAVSVAARSLSGAKQFEIRLDPPELGRVDVRLSIDASGKTQAHMTADQPQTLDLLQKDAPTLTQALRDAGLDVSQSGLNFSLRGQDRQGDDAGAGQGRRTNLTATRTIQAAQTPNALSVNGAAADARVDIHV